MNIKGLREVSHASPYFFAPQKSISAPQFATTGHFVGVTFIPLRIRMYCSVIPTVAFAVVGASHARIPIHATRFVLLLKHQTAPNDHWRFNRHNIRLQLSLFLQLWRSRHG
ncbi:hypothetical protein [Pseudomonas sp. GM18]|uniref:hypothetical protein n=1 Tax=Pseudomonas sp. GM18 TaxID=1144324 RepID=UPI0012F89333|nr:hypothetical protein [Pseudomonas sp. GM18]